jgi:hypothetical protein
MNNSKIRLDGCQVLNLEYNDQGKPESALIQFGMLYYPLRGSDIDRLSSVDSNVEMFEGAGTHKNYFLDVSGLDRELEKTYEYTSQLFGVDFRSELFKMRMTEEAEDKQKAYSQVKDKLRIREW